MSRSEELLLAAAECLDEGKDPFHESFLVEHNVTLGEVHVLGEELATGARLFVNIKRELSQGGLAATVAAHRLVEALAVQP